MYLRAVLFLGLSFLKLGLCHKCYVCEPDIPTQADQLEMKRSFSILKFPRCSEYKAAKSEEYLRECPKTSSGCLTQFKGDGNVLRTCAPVALDDCKMANGINYCYCSKEGCNNPHPLITDPAKPAIRHYPQTDIRHYNPESAGTSHYNPPPTSEQQYQRHRGASATVSDGRYDDEDVYEYDEDDAYGGGWDMGSGDYFDNFYYDGYYDEITTTGANSRTPTSSSSFGGVSGGFEGGSTVGGDHFDDTEDDRSRTDDDYYDMTEPPPFIEQELEEELEKISGGRHKFDRRPPTEVVGGSSNDNGIVIVEGGSSGGETLVVVGTEDGGVRRQPPAAGASSVISANFALPILSLIASKILSHFLLVADNRVNVFDL